MDSKDLTKLVKEAQHSNDAMYKLIEKFEPLIKKCAHILSPNPQDREDGEQEFRIALIKAVRHCPVDNFAEGTDLPMIGYIVHALKNRLARLGNQKRNTPVVDFFDEDPVQLQDSNPVMPEISAEILNLLSFLSPNQRVIIVGYYYYGYSDQELALKFRVSRQAVHKDRMKALKMLKEHLQ